MYMMGGRSSSLASGRTASCQSSGMWFGSTIRRLESPMISVVVCAFLLNLYSWFFWLLMEAVSYIVLAHCDGVP